MSRTVGLVGLLLLVISSWAYELIIEEPGIRSRASMTFSPGYSDLSPRWRGTYELLRHGRDPYGTEVTIANHEGLTGQTWQPGDPIPYADGFAYPLYFALFMAPLTLLPYEDLMIPLH